MELLKAYNVELKGKRAVVIGRSNIVGIPIFNLLSSADATVTLCHSKTVNLESIVYASNNFSIMTSFSLLYLVE